MNPSGPLWISVEPARTAIVARVPRRITRSHRLVDVDAEAGILVRVTDSVPDLRQAWVQLPQLIIEVAAFADSEGERGQVDMQIDAVADWRHVSRSVPCGLDTVDFAEHRHFPCHAQS